MYVKWEEEKLVQSEKSKCEKRFPHFLIFLIFIKRISSFPHNRSTNGIHDIERFPDATEGTGRLCWTASIPYQCLVIPSHLPFQHRHVTTALLSAVPFTAAVLCHAFHFIYVKTLLCAPVTDCMCIYAWRYVYTMHFFTAKTTGTLRLKPPLSYYEKAKKISCRKNNFLKELFSNCVNWNLSLINDALVSFF